MQVFSTQEPQEGLLGANYAVSISNGFCGTRTPASLHRWDCVRVQSACASVSNDWLLGSDCICLLRTHTDGTSCLMSELANTTGQLEFNTMCQVASQCVWTLWCVSSEMKDEIWEPLKHDMKTFWEGFFLDFGKTVLIFSADSRSTEP